jgi:hypothetical protein
MEQGRGLSKTDFAAAFFDRDGGDPVVTLLREAAETAASAKSQADLWDASTLLAAAEQKIDWTTGGVSSMTR